MRWPHRSGSRPTEEVDSWRAHPSNNRIRSVKRRSFHRPGWTCVTRTRRPARPTGGNRRFWPVICAATAARVSEASGAIAWWMVTSTPLENFSGSAASRPSPGRSSCRNTRPGRSRRGAAPLCSSQRVDRQNTYRDPQPARHPPQTGGSSHHILPRATSHQGPQRHRGSLGGSTSQRTRGRRRVPSKCAGDADVTRARAPGDVASAGFRQPDVTRHIRRRAVVTPNRPSFSRLGTADRAE